MRRLFAGFDLLATFDDERRELPGGSVLVEDGTIVAVGTDMGDDGVDEVVDCRGLVGLPGLINAHQHLYQGGFRALPELERATIGPWLGALGAAVKGRWEAGRFGPEVVEAVAAAVLTESLLGGQTTVADQHYFFPHGSSLPYIEATIAAAGATGVRLHACRGTLTAGADPVTTQTVDEVVRHCAALIDAWHDPHAGASVRIALAPCGAHVDEPALFDELAALAADADGVRLHTHLYEQVDVEVCRRRYGCTPWELLAAHGWAQPRVWLAHVTNPPLAELTEMADAGVAIAHLPAPDLRMGWGTAPARAMLEAGVAVGFGTTGSASNDGADLLGDLRLASLVHRADPNPDRWLSARELLAMATRGSAACLGRDDLGVLRPGAQCDLAGWNMRGVDRVGVHDPLAGLLLTGLSSRAALVAVAGEILVEGGEPVRVDPTAVAARAREALGIGDFVT